MKLQAALDTLDLQDAAELIKKTKDHVDIIEVGTPMLMRYGIQAIKDMKAAFPQKTVLADAKIMDGGKLEADMCFEAGADIVTVLGCSHDATIKDVIQSARDHGKKVMVDMIAVKDLEGRTEEIDGMGADWICVHTAFDIQSDTTSPLADLQTIKKAIKQANAAVAGGVKPLNAEAIARENPDIVVAGGWITNAKNPDKACQQLLEALHRTIQTDRT